MGIKTGKVEILFYIMMSDSFLGIVKALRLGKKFSFKILLWGLIVKMLILSIPLLLALMGKGLELDFTGFLVVVMNIIIVSESISCVTNIISIKTQKQLENTDYITMLLHIIKKTLEALIGSEVTITVYYYVNHNMNGKMVVFDGGSGDIIVS